MHMKAGRQARFERVPSFSQRVLAYLLIGAAMPQLARAAEPTSLDLSKATVVAPASLTGPEKKAVTMLAEEVERRTNLRWEIKPDWPDTMGPTILVGSGAS